jgi:hypothetical protein
MDFFKENLYNNNISNNNYIQNNNKFDYHTIFDNVILTCYITSFKDPIHHSELIPLYGEPKQPKDNFDYMKNFYNTVLEKNLHCIIFHDSCSDEFIKKYETDKIKFIKIDVSYWQYSINDERFTIYYEFLKNNPYKKVLMCDISDVLINKNPFDIINDDYKIFAGTNHVLAGPKIRTPQWFERRQTKVNRFNKYIKKFDNIGWLKNDKYQVYNAGLLAGNYKSVIKFLSKFDFILRELMPVSRKANWNMVIFNYIINKYLLEDYNENTFHTKYLISGYPFNSMYKKYEKLGESKCCLIHK